MADTSLIFNIIARDKTKGGFDQVKAGAAAAGVAVGAVLVAGIAQAMEKSRLDNKLAAQLGATPAEAKKIGQISGQVYAAGFGEDLPAVNAAIKAAAQNGLIDIKTASAETAAAAAKNLLTVGTVLEEDSERVSSAVSQMLRTGLAKSSEEAMDLLVKATQNGVNKSQDLLDTMNEYGTQFRKLGLEGPAAMGLMSQAIQAGARDSDTAADALKEFSIRAVDGSKATTAGFKAIGLDAQVMAAKIAKGGSSASEALDQTLDYLSSIPDPVKRSAAAVQLFGTKAEDLGDALYAMDPSTAAKALGQVGGATAKAAAQASAGAAGWSTLGRQFQMALVDTLNKALPVVNAVFGFMQRNSSWVQPLATGLAVLAVVIAVVVAAQWAWNAALAVSPVTWIIIGIVALIAVIVIIATKTTWFQAAWEATWGFLKKVGAWFAGPFANFFVRGWQMAVGAFNRAKASIMGNINMVRGFFLKLWNTFQSINQKIILAVAKMIVAFQNAPGKIRGALGNMFSGLWTGFKSIVNRIIGGWNRLSFGIPGISFAGISVPGVSVGTPDIPYLATGGRIQSDGLIYAHAGETVTKKAQVSRTGPGTGSGSGGGGATITVNGSNAKVVRVLLELLREGIRDKGGDVVKVLTPG